MKILTKIGAYFDRANGFLACVLGVIIAFMALSVALAVTIRFFLRYSNLWIIEICEYSLLLITFLGGAWVLQREGHVKIDVVVNSLSPRGQALLNFITSVLGATVCLAFAWYSAQATWVNFAEGIIFDKIISPPRGPFMLCLPIGGFLLFVQFLRRAYGYLWNLGGKHPWNGS